MKKILVLFGIIAFAQAGVMAYMYENETASVPTLQAQGFSQSTAEVADWAKYRNGGIHTKYVRYYQPKSGNILGRSYQKLKEYFDPVQDNGTFGDSQIEFSNTWSGDNTFYSSDRETNRQVERL